MNMSNIPKNTAKGKLPKEGTKLRAVADYLLEYGEITSWQAITMFRYTRLSDGIYRLKNDYGWRFDVENITENGTTYSRYILLGSGL